MFFALLFLILAAFTSYFFPEWSWVTILSASFGCVAVLRILLAVASRSAGAAGKKE